MDRLIYFDYAATTPVKRSAIQAMVDALGQFGNPSSRYAYARQAAQRVKEDRETVAKAFGCAPAELFFTSCGTEGDNWAIRRGVEANRRKGKHIVTTAIEHAAVLETCRDLERQGYEVTYRKPDRAGRITAEQLTAALLELADTILLTVDGSRLCRTKWEEFRSQHELYNKFREKTVLTANRGSRYDAALAASLVSLPLVKSEDPVVVYKTLSAGYFQV